jgi:hypothetical protein
VVISTGQEEAHVTFVMRKSLLMKKELVKFWYFSGFFVCIDLQNLLESLITPPSSYQIDNYNTFHLYFLSHNNSSGYGGGYNERGNVEYKDPVSSDSEYDEFGRRKKKTSNKKSMSTKSSRETSRRSRSRSSSNSTSSSDRSNRRKRSRRSRSRSPKRSRRRSSSSSSRSRERTSNKKSSTREPQKEKSPQNVREEEEDDDDEEESGDEDLSKYDLFDDDFVIEKFKKNT